MVEAARSAAGAIRRRARSITTTTVVTGPRAIGHVFVVVLSNGTIDAYIGLKEKEITRFSMTTHPVEFDMYYSL